MWNNELQAFQKLSGSKKKKFALGEKKKKRKMEIIVQEIMNFKLSFVFQFIVTEQRKVLLASVEISG